MQCDLPDPPLLPARLELAAGRGSASIAGARRRLGITTVVVDLERGQHGGLPAEHDVVRGDSPNVCKGIAREDGIRQQRVEDHGEALALHLLLGGVHAVAQDRAASLDEASVLPGCSDVERDTPALELLLEVLGVAHAALAVHDEHLHGAEQLDPAPVDGRQERRVGPVLDLGAVVPARGAADEVQHHAILVEQDVAFHVLVELRGQPQSGHRLRCWQHPLAALPTVVDDRRDQVEGVLGDVGGTQHAQHLLLGGVPPS